jgi:hypothetical protein
MQRLNLSSWIFSVKRSLGSVFLFQAKTLLRLGWVLFGLCWLLPNHYRPWPSFHSEALAFCSVALIALGYLGSPPGVASFPSVVRWILVVALVPWLQWFNGINFFAGDALLSFFFLLGWAIAVFVGFQMLQEHGSLPLLMLMHALWIAAMLSAMIGLTQWLLLDEFLGIFAAQIDPGDPVMGNLAQPNQFATFLLIGILAYTYVFERRLIGWTGFVLGVLFMTSLLVMTHSRAGMVGVIVVGGFLLFKRSAINSRLSSRHLVMWMAFFAIACEVSPYLDHALLLSEEREPLFTTNGRALIWRQVLDGIGKSPWFGFGWNQTPTALFNGAINFPGTAPVTYAHTVLLDIVAWNGWPLGLVLITLGSYWFLSRMLKVKGLDAGYAMACLLPFTMHSLVEFPYAYAYFLVTAGIMMGIVEADHGSQVNAWTVKRLWVGFPLFMWALVGVLIVREYFLIEEDFRIVRFENLRVGTTDASYEVPDIWLLSHMATMLKVSRLDAVPNMTNQQLEELREVAMRFPYGALCLRYATALALNGDPEGARRTMNIVLGMYGVGYYSAALEVWMQTAEIHPQLKAIHLPEVNAIK